MPNRNNEEAVEKVQMPGQSNVPQQMSLSEFSKEEPAEIVEKKPKKKSKKGKK